MFGAVCIALSMSRGLCTAGGRIERAWRSELSFRVASLMYQFKTDPGSRNEYESYFGEESIIEIEPSPSLDYMKVGNYEVPITTDIYK